MVYKIEIKENGVWVDYTSFCRLPFIVTERLDTGLDGGQITLDFIDKAEAFKPYTDVKITADSKVFNFYISSPQIQQVVYDANAKYTHSLSLIEQTKITETVYADTLTVTQRLRGVVVPQVTSNKSLDVLGFVLFDVGSPIYVGRQITFPTGFSRNAGMTSNKVIEFSNLVTTSADWAYTITTSKGSYTAGSTLTIEESDVGLFFIEIFGDAYTNWNDRQTFTIRYEFEVLKDNNTTSKRTIATELNRIVQVAELRRNGVDNQKYTIDPAILTRYVGTPCPEFSFTRQTLWEMLLQVGDYIHAIPRLITTETQNIITYDFLGSQEITENSGVLSYKESSYDINNYATEIDSHISNIMNVDNIAEGSLLDPAENIFKTPRVEQGGIEISDDTAIFSTDKEIAQLVKLEVQYNGVVKDITKYCYESFEYDVLSSYIGYYLYSKAYALRYVLGRKNIDKLQHKNEDLISPAFKNWAIVNILRREGVSINNTPGTIINLRYRIEYIPIINARAKQKKVNQNEYETKATLIYNQTSNEVNSNAYGENMKGAILRYGNEEKAENYYTNSILKIPKLGTVKNRQYVSVINYEFYKEFIKYSVEYSKDFNKLSGFTGIHSNVRMYEISERQAIDRNLHYSGVITIGTQDTEKQNSDTIIKINARRAIAQTFCQEESWKSTIYDPTMAVLTTFKENGDIIKKVGLPLNTFGLGNSMVFTCNYKDNYSAGEKAVRGVVTNKLIQDYVPYGDEYGGAEYLSFSLTRPLANGGYDYQAIGDSLPEINGITFDLPAISSQLYTPGNESNDLTSAGALIVKKDNREALQLTIQIDFCVNDNDIIVGYGLTNLNRLVRANLEQPVKAYAMPRKIGQFEKKVNLSGATLIKTFSSVTNDFIFPPFKVPYFAMRPVKTSVNCESIAFVNENGDLVMAINKPLQANEETDVIFFNLK